MTQHTPGPWRVDPDHCRDVQTADGAIEICLAEGGEPYGKNLFSVPSMEEAHANARLIAAAPELLFELKKCASLLKTACSEIDDLTGKAVITQRLESVTALIAKATGETK